ncbi:MAG: hypothetical protein JNK21_12950 [Rhodospirillaceae bacterium]|nr:hypothetical protein [Rhodospirillaceae bacterium]
MTDAPSPAPSTAWSSGRAIAAGLLTTIITSTAMDAVMHGTGIFPAPGEAMNDGLWAWAALYRLVFAALGCYIAARLAPQNPTKHAWIVGGIGLVLGGVGVAMIMGKGPGFGPAWYAIVVALSAIPAAWLGSLVRERQIKTG